jgi:hypothetical protein
MEPDNVSEVVIETRSQKIDRWTFSFLWILLLGSWLYLLSRNLRNIKGFEEITIPASMFVILIGGIILSFVTPKRIFEKKNLKKWYWGGLQFFLTLLLLLINLGGLVYFALKDCC